MPDCRKSVIDFDPAPLGRFRHRTLCPGVPALGSTQPVPGRHRSTQIGGSGEFLAHQPYAGGEDLRRLDWPVFARTGRLFVRRFAQHEPRRFVLALDVSASMTFTGLPPAPRPNPLSKLAYCQHLASAIAQILEWQQDPLGLALLADRMVQWLAPTTTFTHFRQVRQRLSSIQPRPHTRLAPGLEEVLRLAGKPGVLLLLSDFLDNDLSGLMAALHRLRQAHWQVVVGQVLHPDELLLPGDRPVLLVDLESPQSLRGVPGVMRNDYQRRLHEHLKLVQKRTWALGGTYHRWDCAQPWLRGLQELLGERNR